MTNLIDIQTQIEKLQKQASDIKAKEFHSTVQDIRAKMAAFGITTKDLQSGKSGKPAKAGRGRPKSGTVKTARTAKASKGSSSPVAAKYRGPNGETWTGRGLTPKWLAALIAQGQTKESFAIKV
jgi:DNA-binding protein H-NS